MLKISQNTISRLLLYKKLLTTLNYEGISHIFSRKLAKLARVTPEQVRSDLMSVGSTGSPIYGYKISELEQQIGEFIEASPGQSIAVVGLGQVGEAIFNSIYWKYENLANLIALDANKDRINTDINGSTIISIYDAEEVIKQNDILIATLTTENEFAQECCDLLISYGVRGIVNYTNVVLSAPDHVLIDNQDISLILDRMGFFLRNRNGKRI